jgi:CDP-glycerol glycerophosphotransferase (TagB/SpsB family)
LAQLRPQENDELPQVPAELPDEIEVTPPAQLSSRLSALSWQQHTDGSTQLRIEGTAWRVDGQPAGSRITAVTLIHGATRVHCTVRPRSDPAINDIAADPDRDRSDAGFVATVDAAELIPDLPADRVFQRKYAVQITVADAHGEVRDRFRSRDDNGSAGDLHSCAIAADCLAQAAWDRKTGLEISVCRRVLSAEAVSFSGLDLEAVLVCRGEFVPVTALLRRGDDERPLSLEAIDGGRFRVRGPVGDLPGLVEQDDGGRAVSWYLQLVDSSGTHRHVHWQGTVRRGHRVVCAADPRIAARYSPNGVIRVDIHLRRLITDAVTVDDDGNKLTITGECHGLPDDPVRWLLTGGHRPIPSRSLGIEDGRFSVTFGLHAVPEWGRTIRPLAGANLRLTVSPDRADQHDADQDADQIVAGLDPQYSETLPTKISTDDHRIRVERETGGRLRIVIGPPRAPGEVSKYSRRRFEVLHRTTPARPTETVWLDSFDGKAANDSTLAVRNELVRRRPELRRVWTVADLSIEVPDGDERCLIRSQRWWQELSAARLVVTNCWTPQQFRRRDHQRVLQTWHGTPLKLLGFDRIGTKRGIEYERRTIREVSQWDWLIAQNPYSASIFRSAYGYQGAMLEIGYPRNDILVNADDDHRADVRDRLGLDAGERVVLYVPTWRENSKALFSELDFTAVCQALGDHGRLLVRGHVNTVKHGTTVVGDRLLDVTLYPELSDLYLIADVMITDYSSTMFDFSITGKPMIFFAPDIEEYTGTLRGTYFDLAAEAPGPILSRTEEVLEAINDLDEVARRHQDRYAAWRRKFNPYDDGHAAERAVDALLAGIDQGRATQDRRSTA